MLYIDKVKNSKKELKVKKLIFAGLSVILFILLLSAYTGFTKLKRITTSHFVVTYPQSAENIVNKDFLQYMEDTYSFLSQLFHYDFSKKIYVYISGNEEAPNGFDSPIGHQTIFLVLVPADLDSSIGNYDSWLRMVFYHECTHQFSLSLKKPLQEFLSGVFGNIFLPTFSNNPFFMMEGVTTSFESKTGYGRVNNPYIKQYIIQNILDDEFKLPGQLNGNFNKWPYGSIGYWYGGFFSTFLQEKYGMEKYCDLWEKTVTRGFESAFKENYGITLEEEWKNFYQWIKPSFSAEINYNYLTSSKSLYSNGILRKTEDNTYYYFYDSETYTVNRINIENQKKEIILADIYYFDHFSINTEGNLLVLNYYILESGFSKYHARIYDLIQKKYMDSPIESIPHMREISFSDSGWLGIITENSTTDLAFVSENGEKKILVKGNEYFYISFPQQLNRETIVFLGAYKGTRSLYSYDITENKLSILRTNARFISNINVFDGKIMFIYNDGSLSKFGMISDAQEILFQKNISGGFFDPFFYNNTIYYISHFSHEQALMFYPADFEKNIFQSFPFSYDQYDDPISGEIAEYLSNTGINQEKNSQESGNGNTNDGASSDIKNENNPVINESDFIYPFGENLFPILWTPMVSLFIDSADNIYYNGIGINLFFYNAVEGKISNMGIYTHPENPEFISYDIFLDISLFKPLNLYFVLYNYYSQDIFSENFSRRFSVQTQANLSLIDFPGLNRFVLTFHQIYDKLWSLNNDQWDFDYQHFIVGVNFMFLLATNFGWQPDLTVLRFNLTYDFSVFNNDSYFHKVETYFNFILPLFSSVINGHFAYAPGETLGYLQENIYFNLCYYPSTYELYSESPEQKFDKILILSYDVTIANGHSRDLNPFYIFVPIYSLNLDLGIKTITTGFTQWDYYSYIKLSFRIDPYNIAKIDFYLSLDLKNYSYYFYYILSISQLSI